MQIPLLAFVFGAALTYVVGDVASKMWSLHHSWLWALLALSLYLIASFFLMNAIRMGGISFVVVIQPVVTLLVSFTVGHLFFGERLGNIQYIGATLAVVALALMLLPIKN